MRHRTEAALCALALLALAGTTRGHGGHEGLASRGSKVEPGGIIRLTSEARASVGLAVAPVVERRFVDTVAANGRVTTPWNGRAFATARIGGRVTALSVKPWDRVARGDALATIESTELEDFGLAVVQARLRRTFLETALDRERELVKKGVSAGKDLLQLETELAKTVSVEETALRKLGAVTGLERADVARIASERAPLRSLVLRAPIDGVVVHLDVTLGEVVESTKHLFEIHDVSTAWVEARVNEARAGAVRVGQRAVVRSSVGAFEGQVVYLDQEISETDRAVAAYVQIDNRSGVLRENLPVKVEVAVGAAEDAVAVPKAAIVALGVERFVFVEEEPGVYRRRDVVTGLSDAGHVEARTGVYLGDRVVVAGQHELGTFFAAGELHISAEARERLGVADAEVELGDLDEVTHLVGRLRVPSGREAVATARVHGKVSRVVAQAGATVRPGDVVAEIESLELQSLELDLIQEDLELGLARKNFERVRGLAVQDIEPRAELLRLENDLQRQAEVVMALTRKLRLLGLTADEIEAVRAGRELLRGVPVRAPLAGVVSQPLVALGQVVEVGTQLYRIQDQRELWVEGAATASDLAQMKVGLEARVRLDVAGGALLEARLSFVGQALDEQSRTLPVYVTVENPEGRLQPGMQASLDIVTGRAPGPEGARITAPASAILSETGQTVVVLVEGPTFRRVPVELGARRDDTRVEVVRGLFPGDRVVTRAAEEIRSAILSLR